MTFSEIFQGKMYGVLSWQKFDGVWDHLRANPSGWYVWQCDQPQPTEPMSKAELTTFLVQSETFLRKQDRAKRCGFVYLDDPESPTFLKIFHPRKMGSGCGCSGEPVLPYWTISKVAPAPFVSQQEVVCEREEIAH